MSKCLICWDPIKDPLFLPCAHGYCKNCVIKLIEKRTRKCPVCRTRITWTTTKIKDSYQYNSRYVVNHSNPFGK